MAIWRSECGASVCNKAPSGALVNWPGAGELAGRGFGTQAEVDQHAQEAGEGGRMRPRSLGQGRHRLEAIFQMIRHIKLRGRIEHRRLGHPHNHDQQVLGQSAIYERL